MRKLTYEYVRSYLEEQGCEMLDEAYLNNSTKINYKCSCGNVSKISFANFRNGRRCRKCSIERRVEKQQVPFEFVQQYFKDQGCKLLETEYKNCKTKMKYRCSCGNISKIRFSQFKRGHRCRECRSNKNAKRFSFTFEFVKEFFEENGCKMLDTEYKNARTHINYECSCGNISKIIFDSFRSGHRCNKCASETRANDQAFTFDYVYNHFEDHGCKLLEDKYVNIQTKMRYRCKCGKINFVTFNHFKKSGMCAKCSTKGRSGENHYEWKKDRVAHERDKKLKQRCYKMLRNTLKKTCQKKIDRTHEMLGYTFKNIQNHVYNHPNWENIKNSKWNLDHIFPIKAFLDYNIRDIKLINCLENLQPLSWQENTKKSANYNKDEFEKWLRKKKYDI